MTAHKLINLEADPKYQSEQYRQLYAYEGHSTLVYQRRGYSSWSNTPQIEKREAKRRCQEGCLNIHCEYDRQPHQVNTQHLRWKNNQRDYDKSYFEKIYKKTEEKNQQINKQKERKGSTWQA
tara:strand:+ start:1133 stop:1498 length:366 start_codon:yes stop_codon:yes gene_type:complete